MPELAYGCSDIETSIGRTKVNLPQVSPSRVWSSIITCVPADRSRDIVRALLGCYFPTITPGLNDSQGGYYRPCGDTRQPLRNGDDSSRLPPSSACILLVSLSHERFVSTSVLIAAYARSDDISASYACTCFYRVRSELDLVTDSITFPDARVLASHSSRLIRETLLEVAAENLKYHEHISH